MIYLGTNASHWTGTKVKCKKCRNQFVLTGQEKLKFRGYTGFGMASCYGEFSINCPSCNTEIIFEIAVAGIVPDLAPATALYCSDCKKFLDQGISFGAMAIVFGKKETHHTNCPYCNKTISFNPSKQAADDYKEWYKDTLKSLNNESKDSNILKKIKEFFCGRKNGGAR